MSGFKSILGFVVELAPVAKKGDKAIRSHFRACQVLGCLITALFVLAGMPALANPVGGNTDNCTIAGAVVHEHNFFGVDKDFTVNFTDKTKGAEIVTSVHAGVIQAGQTVTVGVPAAANGLLHCDVINHSVAVGGGGGPGNIQPNARQELKIEALVKDPITGEVRLGSIFDFVFQAYGSGVVFMPDLWGNTNGDGVIGDGDLLYSLIDLREYTNSGADLLSTVNARFFAGQAFNIVGGIVVGLPGMMFSTTEFTFDPATGYHGTAYTGTGFAVTDHGIGVVPEPMSLPLFLIALVAAFNASRRRQVGRSGARCQSLQRLILTRLHGASR